MTRTEITRTCAGLCAERAKTAGRLFWMVCLLAVISCAHRAPGGSEAWRKIEIDLSQLDNPGLRGPPDGRVAVSYEFAIPDTEACRAQVKDIDKTVEFMPGSRGRIGAGEGQCLCVGSTFQPDFREVLHALSELPYVARIIECHFE